MDKVVRIDVLERRLRAIGRHYYLQGGTVIRSIWCESLRVWRETPEHHSVTSVAESVAGDAYLVLGPGEELAAKWREMAKV